MDVRKTSLHDLLPSLCAAERFWDDWWSSISVGDDNLRCALHVWGLSCRRRLGTSDDSRKFVWSVALACALHREFVF